MLDSFDFGVILRSAPYLFGVGMVFTLKLTLMAMAGGLVAGTLLALMRLSSSAPLRWIASIYVNLIRAIPLVLVIFWFFFLVPYIGGWVTRSSSPIEVGAFSSALITFVMFEAAYYCEIMRAGIQAVPRGQVFAAQALGMGYRKAMAHVILPQAFRTMLPLLLTQSIVLFQDVSLVYVVSITDFVGAAAAIAQRDGRLLEMYL
jgi:glutamate/aspartate transport system permease protein